MKTTKKALSLGTETIRVLDDAQLANAVGGNACSNSVCFSNIGDNNRSCICRTAADGGGGEGPK